MNRPGPAPRIGIVLSGWAPAMTLMSGVMRGFIEKGIAFDVISTSGIGGLIGLLALAPKGSTSPAEALRELPNLFVSDLLHVFVPANFKMFYKHGPFAELAYQFRKTLPRIPVDPGSASPLPRLFNDWIDLVLAAATPTSLDSYRNGLLSQVSMIEDLVDFTKLQQANAPRFYLSAFDLAAKAQRVFNHQDVGANPYRAAQAMFLFFPPERVDGRLFTTGATHDPTGLQAIWLHERDRLDMVIALDPISRAIWRAPVNIQDAFQLMLLNPIVALQTLLLAWYAETEVSVNPAMGPLKLPKLYRIPFDMPPCDIPPAYYPQMLEWTHANAVTLECIGRCAAKEFADVLHSGDQLELERRYRYVHHLDRRAGRFMEMFHGLRLFDRDIWSRFHRPDGDKPGASRRPPRPDRSTR